MLSPCAPAGGGLCGLCVGMPSAKRSFVRSVVGGSGGDGTVEVDEQGELGGMSTLTLILS